MCKAIEAMKENILTMFKNGLTKQQIAIYLI